MGKGLGMKGEEGVDNVFARWRGGLALEFNAWLGISIKLVMFQIKMRRKAGEKCGVLTK